MPQRLILRFDGQVFHPEQPLNLAPGTRMEATIEELPEPEAEAEIGRPLRVFDTGGPELRDEDLYPFAEEAVVE